MVNAVTASRLHTGIPSMRKDNTIHSARLSDIGHAVTEQEAMEIEKEHTNQSTSGAEQKRSVSFSKVCEVIIPGNERDKVRHHLFHYYQNRPKDNSPTDNYAVVDEDKVKNEQGQKEVDKTEGCGWRQAGGSRCSPDGGQHPNGKDGGFRAQSPAQWTR